jgi:hypothetical protein
MKKIYILLFLFASFGFKSIAQGDQYITLQYSTGIGFGDTYDYISKFSFRGVSLDYKKFIYSDRFAVGADFNWNVLFEDMDYGTFTYGSVSLSGNQNRSMNLLPLMATADYFFADTDKMIQPFVGMGIGTINSIQNVDMGLYRYNHNEWHFGLKPQVGFWYYVSETSKLCVSSEFLYGFKTNSTKNREMLTFNIGMAFMLQ